ncbi:MarR family winged helix-turn-helix transcriptional regulator [Aquabacterium sp.]|uniref:MarR family winged helix-turn-helix transcriptional regulator n=1 Tax=Aquabacterium sp. TaxID=1872578 RepID=UPI002C89C18E|nr:MarR family transcriptional regulator [Aquabacterium sp.]HSW06800.1 MarR family transcriptional regulator [Aquabacterium sp.]
MSSNDQWLDLGLAALPPPRAQRIRLFRTLLATAAVFRGQLDRALAPAGITSQQAALLQLIEAQAEAPAISFVAQALGMTHQNVKQIALALERKGFLVIATDANDRRTRRLQLTEHHHQFWRQRNPTDFSSVEAWTAGLTDDEIDTLVALLARLKLQLKGASHG